MRNTDIGWTAEKTQCGKFPNWSDIRHWILNCPSVPLMFKPLQSLLIPSFRKPTFSARTEDAYEHDHYPGTQRKCKRAAETRPTLPDSHSQQYNNDRQPSVTDAIQNRSLYSWHWAVREGPCTASESRALHYRHRHTETSCSQQVMDTGR